MHIYKWTNIQNGKVYIGQSIQEPNRRRLEHITHSRYSDKTYHFHNALRKYGLENFTWEVIDYASSLKELDELEDFYINSYDSINKGYNIREAGNSKIHSEESKERMRESQRKAHERRRNNGTEGGWTRRDGGPMKGKKCSEEHKRKVSEANKKPKRKSNA